jgi:hypothetical protein
VVVGPERAKVLASRYEVIRARTVALCEKVGKGESDGNSYAALRSAPLGHGVARSQAQVAL